MNYITYSLTSLFFLCLFCLSNQEGGIHLDCEQGHAHHELCQLKVGPKLENPPKIYSRFHDRGKDGYIGLLAGRGDNGCITADIDVTYDSGFTAAARDAFQFAVEIWERCVVSDVRIIVNATFQPAGATNLGSAGASQFWQNFSDAPVSNTFYSQALANSIADSDLDNTMVEINANFNSSRTDWYFGIDGNCPNDRFDFVTVVLHELCHGLGFSGSGFTDGTLANTTATLGGTPIIYDTFVESAAGTQINNFADGTPALRTLLQSGSLFFDSPNVRTANGGARARLFAPATFNPGSSYSHYDENDFPGVLMTPFLSEGEVIHDPGDLSVNLLQDLGWDINEPCYSGSLYVDKGNNFLQTGSNTFPFKTFVQAVSAAEQGNYIYFKSSGDHTSSAPIVITKRMQVRLASGNNGPVIIK